MGEEKTIEKQRSAAYPAATMESCYDILNAIKALGGKSCSYQTLADKLGTSITTYSFKAKISYSKQYGFIENIKNVIQLSERGRLLIYPTQNVNEKEILLGCFQNPTLYGKLIQNFLGKALPPTDRLSNELMKPYYGITATGKDVAAECFIKNAEYVGALQNGILTFDNILDVEVPVSAESVEKGDGDTVSPPSENNNIIPQRPIASSVLGYRFQIPMLSGKSAEIYLPEDISETDIDFFQKSIEVMLPLFMNNLREKLAEKDTTK